MEVSFDPNNPIPNGPFFYPTQWAVGGPLGSLIIGANLCVDAATGTLCAVPPGGVVTSITAGAGLTGGTITSSGTIALAPTGAASGIYTAPTITLNGLGQVVAITSNPVPGTVCCIETGTGLQGGPITSNGTIAIAPTGVVAGTYQFACIDVNPEGQITAATSGVPVTAITAGVGLNGGTITSTGTIDLADTGVTVGCYCYPTMCVDAQGRISSIVSNNVVTCITTGNGLMGGPITTTGQIALTNTGVTAGNYTLSNITVDAQGRISAISDGSAVTQIYTGTGLTGGPITGTGTIALDPLSPDPTGTYTFAAVDVDAFGRVSSAVSGSLCTAITATAPVTISGSDTAINVGIDYASTSACGAVILTDNTATNSSTTALTAAQGYSLQQQLNALAGTLSNQTLAGTFDAFTGVMITVTCCGTADGFVVGSDIPAPDPVNENTFVIVATGGTYSPPGGGGPYNASQGDWFLSNGTQWQWLNIGYDPPTATTINPGVIEIATLTEVQTGTDGTRAVTPDTLFQSYVPNSCYTTQGDLLVGTAVGTYARLPVTPGDGYPIVSCSITTTGLAYGALPLNQNLLTTKGDIIVANATGIAQRFALGTTGQVLTVDTAAPLGVAWCSLTPPIPLACVTAKGVLITGSAALTPVPLASSGTDGDLLHVCNACATGLCWGPLTGYIPCSTLTGKGDIITATNAGTPIALNPGTDGYVLAACSGASSGLTWIDRPPAIPCACITGKGVVISGSAASTPAVLAAGTDGQYLTACSGCATGLAWTTPPADSIPCACITGKGALVTGTAADTPVALPVGANGTILYANSACSSGLEWVCYVPAIPCACLSAKGSIISATSASVPSETTVGTNGQVLTACSACTTGLTWTTPTADIPCSTLTAKGDIIAASAASTPTALPVGTNGQVLLACSACTSGLVWGQPFVNCACYTAKGEILSGTGAATFSKVAAATADCYWLISCSACANGVMWSNTPNTLGDTPVGTVSFFAGVAAPYGWLIADGSAVSRTTFSALFAQIGTVYGAGDGSTTFNLPDLRGMFPRGWDQAGGTARGCDPGRAFGSTQQDAFESHCHIVDSGSSTTVGHPPFQTAFGSGRFAAALNTSCIICQCGNTDLQGGTETRPMNVAMLPCIKWLVTTAPPGPSTNGIPCQCLVGKGSIVTATAADTPVALPVGAEWTTLVACSACSTGVTWGTYGVGPWISAGTINGVGWNSTNSVAVVPGATFKNNVSYRQLGQKEWEVVLTYYASGAPVNIGSGDYLFTLPNSLQFDLTLDWQYPWTGSTGTSTYGNFWYILPGEISSSVSYMPDGNTAIYGGAGAAPYDATRFRIFTTDSSNARSRAMGSAYYQLTSGSAFKVRFRFTST